MMARRHVQIQGARWQAVRLNVLVRDSWRCSTCGKYGNEVDHIRPLKRGGDPWAESNLQTLCRDCHIEKTRKENQRDDPARDAWRALVSEMRPKPGR